MLSGHKAGSEAGGDGDQKKRTTDSCAELCSSSSSTDRLWAVCCFCEEKREGRTKQRCVVLLLLWKIDACSMFVLLSVKYEYE